jgi:hypothetical protein
MAYVLSISATNSLERPFTESLYLRSCSSAASHVSTGTVRHHVIRRSSVASVRSGSSLPPGFWLSSNSSTPTRLASRSLLDLIHEFNRRTPLRRALSHTPQKPSWCSSDAAASACMSSHRSASADEEIDQLSDGHVSAMFPIPTLNIPDDFPEHTLMGATLHQTDFELFDILDFSDEENETSRQSPEKSSEGLPFKRWLSTLRRRNIKKRKTVKSDQMNPTLHEPRLEKSLGMQHHSSGHAGHHKSYSLTSSLGFITAVKSATGTLASTSIAPRSRRGPVSGHLCSDHGSSAFSAVRMSFDSRISNEPVLDVKAWDRSVQRRKIIEELIESEESYIADTKALVNVIL